MSKLTEVASSVAERATRFWKAIGAFASGATGIEVAEPLLEAIGIDNPSGGLVTLTAALITAIGTALFPKNQPKPEPVVVEEPF
jgi:hypothetical protein